MSDTQQLDVAQKSRVEVITTAIQECHEQLCAQRNKVLSLACLVHRTSVAYYAMCDVNGPISVNESDLVMAMSEFHRRGLLQFDPASIGQLSNDYVQSLKMLKQAVDATVTTCDRLAVLTNAQRSAQQPSPVSVPAPPVPAKAPVTPMPVYQSLDEALEAELNAEN